MKYFIMKFFFNILQIFLLSTLFYICHAQSVLHPDIKVISVNTNEKTEILEFDSWSPSQLQIKNAESFYLDDAKLAAVRGKPTLFASSSTNHSDYINVARNLTREDTITGITRNSEVNGIVEAVLICDKEFGDLFQHDRQKILDYFSIYFWDVNLRFRTLQNTRMQFRINAIIVISSPSGQPFIEDARGPDGRAEFNRILERFARWVYSNMASWPKFDIAVGITATQVEWGGGLAHGRTACWIDHPKRRHVGTVVFNDDGGWGSVTIGTHEMAHVLGAPHDDDPKVDCSERGYIMGGGKDDLKHFFSSCSDRFIGEYARTEQGSCLTRLDEGSSPAINPDSGSIFAPTMTEQCKRRLDNEKAFVAEEDTGNCKSMKCRFPNPNGNGWLITPRDPVDNSPCLGGGRCFRGRCLPLGYRIRNVASGCCIRPTNPFSFKAVVDMVECPSYGTPLDRFVLTNGTSEKTLLATPFSSADGKETSEKCVWTGNGEGDRLWTDRCNYDNPWHGWDLIGVGSGEFHLSHRVTGRCVKQEGSDIKVYKNCDKNDRNMRWKLY